jgi:hypothetical protein
LSQLRTRTTERTKNFGGKAVSATTLYQDGSTPHLSCYGLPQPLARDDINPAFRAKDIYLDSANKAGDFDVLLKEMDQVSEGGVQ